MPSTFQEELQKDSCWSALEELDLSSAAPSRPSRFPGFQLLRVKGPFIRYLSTLYPSLSYTTEAKCLFPLHHATFYDLQLLCGLMYTSQVNIYKYIYELASEGGGDGRLCYISVRGES